jgi:hypothetical protein
MIGQVAINLFTTTSWYTGLPRSPPLPGTPVREATDDLLNFPLLPSAQKFQKSVTVHILHCAPATQSKGQVPCFVGVWMANRMRGTAQRLAVSVFFLVHFLICHCQKQRI